MIADSSFIRWLWPLLASFAGAITALSFRPYRAMAKIEIAMSLVVGFATFVGPLAASRVFGKGPIDIRQLGALFYVLASGSNVLILLAIRKIGAFFGTEVPK